MRAAALPFAYPPPPPAVTIHPWSSRTPPAPPPWLAVVHLERAAAEAHVLGIAADRLPGGPMAPPPPPPSQPLSLSQQPQQQQAAEAGSEAEAAEAAREVATRAEGEALAALLRLVCGAHGGLRCGHVHVRGRPWKRWVQGAKLEMQDLQEHLSTGAPLVRRCKQLSESAYSNDCTLANLQGRGGGGVGVALPEPGRRSGRGGGRRRGGRCGGRRRRSAGTGIRGRLAGRVLRPLQGEFKAATVGSAYLSCRDLPPPK